MEFKAANQQRRSTYASRVRTGRSPSSRRSQPPIYRLQQGLGNAAISRLFNGFLQPKLTVSNASDKYEREADRVADQVMRMPAPQSYVTSHRSLLEGSANETGNAMPRLQRQPAPAAPKQGQPNSAEALCEGAEFPPAAVWFSDPMLARIRAAKALMSFGSDGEAVALVQQAVVAWGCDEGLSHLLPKFGVDGLFRSETRAAVKTFQGRQGIDDDGIVGPITMGELDRFIPGGLPPCPSGTEAVPQSDNVATLASGFEGAESQSACNTKCQDEQVSLERDPLPTPEWDVRFVHGSTMAEVFKRPEVARTNPTASPQDVLGLTVPVEPINTWRDAVATTKLGKKLGPQCFECVVDWNLITPTVRSFIATDWAFTPEIGLWHGGLDDSCPTSPQSVMKRTPVVHVIPPDALQRITFAEMEHFQDFAFAFHLVSARYLATMRRLISGRTHLRGPNKDECEAKTFQFILPLLDFIPPFLIGMAHDVDFVKTFTPSKTVRDDGRDHSVAVTDPPKNRKANRPVPRFNCFFHRNLTAASFPRIPGPVTQEVIKDLNTPPFHPWHVL